MLLFVVISDFCLSPLYCEVPKRKTVFCFFLHPQELNKCFLNESMNRYESVCEISFPEHFTDTQVGLYLTMRIRGKAGPWNKRHNTYSLNLQSK